jgi:hypothetical protein
MLRKNNGSALHVSKRLQAASAILAKIGIINSTLIVTKNVEYCTILFLRPGYVLAGTVK